MNLKIVALILIALRMLWEGFLQLLDHRSLKNPVPVCVSDVYDREEYRKWRAYKGEKKRLGVWSTLTECAVDVALIVFDCYAAFAGLFPQNVYAQLLSVVLLTTVAGTLSGLPFAAYDTFVIEEKFGFNRQNRKTFILDQIKSLVIGMVLVGGLTCLFALIHRAAGNIFIPLFAGAVVLITLVLSAGYPYLSRIFNKFRPLEDGELKEKLTKLLSSHGYKVRAVEVMDASKRSTKMNAYFSGIGPTKSIVLYDTMAEAMTDDQICSVFAHEMGHGLHHDIVWTNVFSVLNAVLLACIAWLVVSSPAVYADFGFAEINYGFAFILLSMVFSILSPVLHWLSSLVSRRAEYRADATAADEGYGEALISALKLLAKKNLVDLSPDPLLVKLTYSHPTLAQRIEALEKRMGKKQ